MTSIFEMIGSLLNSKKTDETYVEIVYPKDVLTAIEKPKPLPFPKTIRKNVVLKDIEGVIKIDDNKLVKK